MLVWITQTEGYQQMDPYIEVNPSHGGRGSWVEATSIAVDAVPHEIVAGSLPAADVALVTRWIELNRDVILDYWNEIIDFDEIPPRLRKLP